MAELSKYEQRGLHDVQLGLARGTGSGFIAELQLPDGERVTRELENAPASLLDETSTWSDPRPYGRRLFKWLFQEDLLSAYEWVMSLQSQGEYGAVGDDPGRAVGVRFRVVIRHGAEPLRWLRWEALHDPRRELSLSVLMAFSRCLGPVTRRSRPLRERPLRVKVLAGSGVDTSPDPANETAPLLGNLSKLIQGEDEEGENSVLSLQPTGLPTRDELAKVRAGECHVLHFVAPVSGQVTGGAVVLDMDGGGQELVPLSTFAGFFGDSPRVPSLIFLMTPRPVTGQDGEIVADLATALSNAGTQVVVAIQAPMSTDNLLRFVEKFYAEVWRSGSVDIATSLARAPIRSAESWDWLAPVVYTRTAEAQLFLPPPPDLMAFDAAFDSH